MERTLIKNATIISVDPKIGDLHRGDILIEGSKIAAVAASIPAGGAEIVDGTDRIAIPGFVDSHRHTWEALLRATGADWTLAQYFTGVRKVMGGLYTPEDNYVANNLGALDALDAGITTLYDWSHNNNSPEHSDASVKGLMDAGIRAVFGYGNANVEWLPISEIPTNYDDVRRVKKKYFSSADQLVTMALAPRGAQYTTMEITEADFKVARDLGLRITVHAGDGLWGMNDDIGRMHAKGLLGSDITYVHCNTLNDEEYRLIGATGGTASIAPELEMHMGHGLPPALKLLAAGVRPSISIDVVTTVPGDMFSAMRALIAGTRLIVNIKAIEEKKIVDPLPLTSRDVLEFATLQGARACGLDHKVGSLTPGKEADIVLINTNAMNLIPLNNPVGAVVEFSNVGNIETIYIAGKAKKKNGKLIGIDFPAFRKRVDAQRDALFERAHAPTDGSWIVKPYTEEAKSEF
jgi:cytosine/adenosine deaminase-related metal-dependent hydrolase